MHTPTASHAKAPAPALDAARAQLAGFLDTPLIQAPERSWRPEYDQAELLAQREAAALPRRFTDEPITGWGGLS